MQGILNVTVYLDDILVTGKADSDHLKSLAAVLERLSKAGHVMDAKGLHPLSDKVQAI